TVLRAERKRGAQARRLDRLGVEAAARAFRISHRGDVGDSGFEHHERVRSDIPGEPAAHAVARHPDRLPARRRGSKWTLGAVGLADGRTEGDRAADAVEGVVWVVGRRVAEARDLAPGMPFAVFVLDLDVLTGAAREDGDVANGER